MKITNASHIIKHILSLNIQFIKQYLQKRSIARQRLRNNIELFPNAADVLSLPYLFVLSTGRCGTGLITRILDASPKLYVEHNPKPELEYVSSQIHKNGVDLNALKLAIIAARFDAFFLEAYLRGKIYVETNNRISFFAPALSSLLPNSKFIHLVRNPADFVRSGMRRGYYADGVVQHQRLDGSSDDKWRYFCSLEKIVWEWNEINKKIENFKAVSTQDRFLTIKSEYLFKDPEVTSNIFRFLEIENPFSSYRGRKKLKKLLLHPVNKQNSGSFPKYQHWKDTDKITLKRIATLAPMYGYILD